MRFMHVGGLGGVGVALEPLEQLHAVGADDVELREVNVAVDEARHDQPARQVFYRGIAELIQQRRCGPRVEDAATVDDEDTVVEVLASGCAVVLAGVAEAVEDRRAICLPHGHAPNTAAADGPAFGDRIIRRPRSRGRTASAG